MKPDEHNAILHELGSRGSGPTNAASDVPQASLARRHMVYLKKNNRDRKGKRLPAGLDPEFNNSLKYAEKIKDAMQNARAKPVSQRPKR